MCECVIVPIDMNMILQFCVCVNISNLADSNGHILVWNTKYATILTSVEVVNVVRVCVCVYFVFVCILCSCVFVCLCVCVFVFFVCLCFLSLFLYMFYIFIP